MKVSLFDYQLPKDRIAVQPTFPRDACKLLVYHRKNKKTDDDFFFNIDKFFQKGDVLVLNNTKVFPARLFGHKEKTKGKIEILLLKSRGKGLYEVLLKGKVTVGINIVFNNQLKAQVREKTGEVCLMQFNLTGEILKKFLFKLGHTPIPPYIGNSRLSEKSLRQKYQTVYSQVTGSVAAPTAGMHFTKNLLKKLEKKGVKIEYLTLHVGIGTFLPVKSVEINKHQMHAEFVHISAKTWRHILQAKKEKKRIIAVGTTVVRALEGAALHKGEDTKAFKGQVNIFIYPGFKFKIISGLITNFHLPKSTLLMLVSAFIGREQLFKLYQGAIEKKYQFYSFGDAMLII